MNTKYIKFKQNQKLKAKFFKLFQVLHPVGKQNYKLEFFKKGKIYNIFYTSLLKQDTIGKKQVDKNNIRKLDINNNESSKYKIKAVWNSAVYAKKSESDYLPGLYYLVSWKSYLKKKTT